MEDEVAAFHFPPKNTRSKSPINSFKYNINDILFSLKLVYNSTTFSKKGGNRERKFLVHGQVHGYGKPNVGKRNLVSRKKALFNPDEGVQSV